MLLTSNSAKAQGYLSCGRGSECEGGPVGWVSGAKFLLRRAGLQLPRDILC